MLRGVLRKKKFWVALGVIVCSAVFFVLFLFPGGETKSTLSSLILTLNRQIVHEGAGHMTLHFVSPLHGAVTDVNIPTDDTGKATAYQITQVAEDFICVEDNSQLSYVVDCIPLSNIASVTYSIPPVPPP